MKAVMRVRIAILSTWKWNLRWQQVHQQLATRKGRKRNAAPLVVATGPVSQSTRNHIVHVQRSRCRGAEVQQRGGGADQGAEVVQSRSRGDCAGAEVVQSRGRGCIDLVERSRCKCAEVARCTEVLVQR
jgi:hypothetical protein